MVSVHFPLAMLAEAAFPLLSSAVAVELTVTPFTLIVPSAKAFMLLSRATMIISDFI